MEINFFKIEEYINNKLEGAEKEQFEKELQSNNQLAERYNFYKNLKGKQVVDLKPIEFNKKILPEINDINFTERKDVSKGKNGTILGLVAILIALSSLFLITNTSNKDKTLAIQSIIDSLTKANKELNNKYIALLDKDATVVNKDTEDDSEIVTELRSQIEEKEKQIAILKSKNTDIQSVALMEEVDNLKKELAKVKQEYYENSGNYANDGNVSLKTTIRRNFSFSVSQKSLSITWKRNKYKIEIYDSKDNRIKSTSDFIDHGWDVDLPELGFYKLRITSSQKDMIYILIETSKDKHNIWTLL